MPSQGRPPATSDSRPPRPARRAIPLPALLHDAMALINRLDSRDPGFKSALSKLLAFEATEGESIDRAAASILADVRTRGDAALVEYTQRFDRMPDAAAHTLEIPKADWHAA